MIKGKYNIVIISLLLNLILFCSKLYADPLTCPIQPGYIDCSQNKIIITPMPEWNSRYAQDTRCEEKGNIYFKFNEAEYKKEEGVLECSYEVDKKEGGFLATLTLITTNYMSDVKIPNNGWTEIYGVYNYEECDASIYNCPIKHQ